MKQPTTILAAAALLALCSADALARAGGGVSVGRSSPSVARSAPAYRAPSYTPPPAPAPRYTPPTPRTEPSRSSSGAGSAFVGGMAGAAVGSVIGNAISRPDVVVAPGAAVGAPAVVGGAPAVMSAPTVIERPLIGAGGILLLLAAGAGGAYWWTRRRSQAVAQYRGHVPPRPLPLRPDALEPAPIDMDPVVLFYAVQQAAMDDDRKTLDRYCTQGMAMLLSGQPEPDRVATKTLTALTWTRADDGAVRFTFRDQVAGDVASEVWLFSEDGRLDGIEVI